MLRIQIVNTSNLAPASDYRYAVDTNGEIIALGTIEGHRCEGGWAALVKRIAEQHIKENYDAVFRG